MISHLQDLWFDPELVLLSVWSFTCGFHVDSTVSSHLTKTSIRMVRIGLVILTYIYEWGCECLWYGTLWKSSDSSCLSLSSPHYWKCVNEWVSQGMFLFTKPGLIESVLYPLIWATFDCCCGLIFMSTGRRLNVLHPFFHLNQGFAIKIESIVGHCAFYKQQIVKQASE